MTDPTDGRNLAVELSDSEYVRCRAEPDTADVYYLHLADLRQALGEHASQASIKILDFGAGGSPYSKLFPNADYRRADFAGSSSPHFEILPDGRTNAPSSHFDIVLSTQVLEHCRDPMIHLTECLRVLTPGGKLLLTTHGTYQDHGCPHDFRRWTADGLKADLASAGFRVHQVAKLTANARALLFLLLEHSGLWCAAQQPVVRFAARAFYKVLQKLRRPIQGLADGWFAADRVVVEPSPSSVIYIALLAVATRPPQ